MFNPKTLYDMGSAVVGIAGQAKDCVTGNATDMPMCLLTILAPMIAECTDEIIRCAVTRAAEGATGRAVAGFAANLSGLDMPNGSSSSCGFNSFSGETTVLMADGTSLPIAQIAIGDDVYAHDPETGETGGREVTAVWVHTDTMVDLQIGDTTVTTTEDHPFWNASEQSWQQAQNLDIGDHVLTATGATIEVGGINWNSIQTGTAYNLTVQGIHTYHVGTGNADILVHNCRSFPSSADEMTDLLGVPGVRTQTIQGTDRTRWFPNDRTRITMESHPENLTFGDPGWNPRHHGEHYHVHIRPNATTGWNNPAVIKVPPNGYTPGSGTGFVPGEAFPQ